MSGFKSYGDWAFSVAQSSLWNRLPEWVGNAVTLAIFKSYLKTYLFRFSVFMSFSIIVLTESDVLKESFDLLAEAKHRKSDV